MIENKKKNILITGGSVGLGFEFAKHFVLKGSNIIICARNKKNLLKAKSSLENLKKKNQKVFTYKIDVSNESDVRRLYKNISKKFKHIDVLISNAGVYGPKGSLEYSSWKEWQSAFRINCFGSIYLIKIFLRLLKKSRRGKIIQLSGGGATSPLANLSCYATSKAAIVRFTETLSLEIAKYNIDINCIAPGALNTRLLNEIIKAGPKKVGKDFYKKSLKQKANGGAGYEKALELCDFLCSENSNGITGRLLSAQWDNYHIIKKLKKKISDSDIFTLRRIVGKDRSLKKLDK
jgi:short-subunit dehydrogenase